MDPLAVASLSVLLFGNIAALIWGASKLSTTSKFQGELLAVVANDLKAVATLVNGHAIRLEVIETRNKDRDEH